MRAPESESELLRRARSFAGRSIGDVARTFELEVPSSLVRAKGFVGRLVETALGAEASTRPLPDFEELGVEVKTIPIDRRGLPLESTYVSRVSLAPSRDLVWNTSSLKAKLTRVLWVPVEGERTKRISARRFGTALLWSPSPDEEELLRADYEELVQLIALGFVDSITAHRGKILQIRPKAATSAARAPGVDDEGGKRLTLPRGFYLRSKFTASILERYFGPPEHTGRDIRVSKTRPSPRVRRRS